MTDLNTPVDMIEVTQADREAASRWYHYMDEALAGRLCEDGSADHRPIVQAFARHRTDSLTSLQSRVEELTEALKPFVDIGPQKGAWGVISKALDDLAPLTVTVTKAQMKAAFHAFGSVSE